MACVARAAIQSFKPRTVLPAATSDAQAALGSPQAHRRNAGRCGHWPSMARAGSAAASPPCSGYGPGSLRGHAARRSSARGMSRPARLVRVKPKTRSASNRPWGMVTQGAVREEREVLFRGVKPIVHSLIVRRHPTKFPGRAFSMMKRMGHLTAPRHSCANIRHSGPRDRG